MADVEIQLLYLLVQRIDLRAHKFMAVDVERVGGDVDAVLVVPHRLLVSEARTRSCSCVQ